MAKLSVRDIEPAGKRVLVRVDFNVPLKGGEISDETRIQGALPTIQHLLDAGAKVILMSHLGRPGGERNMEFSLRPVADRLGELFPGKVTFADDCTGASATAAAAALQDGEILLLENLRFRAEETANDSGFAQELASLCDIYVNDAFGTAHRAHASTAGVADHVGTCAMGFLMERELKYLIDELKSPAKPFVVILGGKKVSDKIGVIDALLDKADTIIIGGAMQYTFRKAQGYAIGNSFAVDEDIPVAKEALAKAEANGVQLLLPADCVEADDFSNDANTNNTAPFEEGGEIQEGWEGLDIGSRAIAEFTSVLREAKTVVWNRPMGVFEFDAFAAGTRAVAETVAECGAVSIIGGGDSVTAIKKFGLADKMTFISTGGGASLELLEGKDLPGVVALSEA